MELKVTGDLSLRQLATGDIITALERPDKGLRWWVEDQHGQFCLGQVHPAEESVVEARQHRRIPELNVETSVRGPHIENPVHIDLGRQAARAVIPLGIHGALLGRGLLGLPRVLWVCHVVAIHPDFRVRITFVPHHIHPDNIHSLQEADVKAGQHVDVRGQRARWWWEPHGAASVEQGHFKSSLGPRFVALFPSQSLAAGREGLDLQELRHSQLAGAQEIVSREAVPVLDVQPHTATGWSRRLRLPPVSPCPSGGSCVSPTPTAASFRRCALSITLVVLFVCCTVLSQAPRAVILC
mmetsp:Transcript_16440/g.48133  ORF Transcript_16440/g.48133 Transcript_16440/m.48133 type:complete len:296 (-) Transcript_16440:624-1511(-)